MTEKALISDLTWRTLEMQKAAFPNMPHYIAPDEITNLLRSTTRNGKIDVHVVSLAVIADNENDFQNFIDLAQKRGINLHTQEEGMEFLFDKKVRHQHNHIIETWKKARKNGAAKIGGSISARKKEDATKVAIELIREDWPKPSDEFSTKELLARAKVSLNTAKKHLGRRPIAQANYQAKLKRQARKA